MNWHGKIGLLAICFVDRRIEEFYTTVEYIYIIEEEQEDILCRKTGVHHLHLQTFINMMSTQKCVKKTISKLKEILNSKIRSENMQI